MLGEHELAGLHPAGAGLAQFAQHRVDLAFGVAIDGEPVDGVLEDVGGQREDGPPIAGRAGGGAGFGDGIATGPEECVVVAVDHLGGDLGAGHLTQNGHGKIRG